MEKKVGLIDIRNLLLNAEKGDADAQFSLGTCYSYGNGVEKDLRKAEYWWIKAASQCDGKFSYQYRLGYYYFYGFVLSKIMSKPCIGGKDLQEMEIFLL